MSGVDPTDLEAVATAYRAALAADESVEMPITGLDRVGVPVWQVWGRRAGDGGLLGGIGFGTSDAQALVGALGEATEHALGARAVRRWSRRGLVGAGSYADLRRTLGAEGVVDPRLLGLPAGSAYDDDRPLAWLPLRRLRADGTLDDGEVLVPAEAVASAGSELGAPPPGGWLYPPVSNGLGAGPTLAHAAEHGLLEVLQRDGNGLAIRSLDRGVVLDLGPDHASVADAQTRAVLARLAAAGVQVVAKVAATDFGLPNLHVVGAAPGDDVLRGTAGGEAVHPDREVALRKAVLEFAAARARKAYMHGPLDDVVALAPAGYRERVVASMDPAGDEPRVLTAMADWLRDPDAAWGRVRSTALRRERTVAFTDLPATTGDHHEVLADVHGRLTAAGFDVLVAVFPSDPRPDSGMLAVKVVVPGAEVETVAYGRIGERGVRRLLDADRTDLVRVGNRPDGAGWQPVHLTAAGQERLGGPAWLDRAALDRIAEGLLPLHREPSRHTVQQVLAGGRPGAAA